MGTVYDCTDKHGQHGRSKHSHQSALTVGIASFHHYPSKNTLSRYEKLVLANHIGYAIRQRAVYFDVNALLFDDERIATYFEDRIPTAHAMFKAQKPFIINAILNDKYYGNLLDAVLWIDFDAVFLNCSTTIESVLANAERIYRRSTFDVDSGRNSMDILFSRDYFSLTNSGVILYRNTQWTRQFVRKQLFVFQNADHFRFAAIYRNVRHLVDQNVFNALIMGFEPKMNDSSYLRRGSGYLALKEALLAEMRLHDSFPDWRSFAKCLDDEEQAVPIHSQCVGEQVRGHSAILPQFYINVLVGEWIYSNYLKTGKFPYDPFIAHFASSIGKPYFSAPVFRDLGCSVEDIDIKGGVG